MQPMPQFRTRQEPSVHLLPFSTQSINCSFAKRLTRSLAENIDLPMSLTRLTANTRTISQTVIIADSVVRVKTKIRNVPV
jgi:hypothetical protein